MSIDSKKYTIVSDTEVFLYVLIIELMCLNL